VFLYIYMFNVAECRLYGAQTTVVSKNSYLTLPKFLLFVKTHNVSEAGSTFFIRLNGEIGECTLVGSLESASLNLGTEYT